MTEKAGRKVSYQEGGRLQSWLENCTMADLLSSRWHRFCPPPSFHSITLPQCGACLGTCLGWHLASAYCPSAWYLSLPWSSDRSWVSTSDISLHFSLCTDAALGAPAAPLCCRWVPRSRDGALSGSGGAHTALPTLRSSPRAGWATLLRVWLLSGTECNYSRQHPACATLQVSSHPRLQHNRPCSRSAGASLSHKGCSHLYCA